MLKPQDDVLIKGNTSLENDMASVLVEANRGEGEYAKESRKLWKCYNE